MNSISSLAVTERIINQTSCSVVNNGGTSLNTIGQSFKFNSTMTPQARLSAVEFGWLNSTGVSTLTAGTTFNFSIHYNESVAGTTIIPGCSYINVTYTTAVAASCGTSVILNLTAFNSTCILNTTSGGGNYTFEVTISGEGGSAQLWTIEDSTNPYTQGKCYGCGGGGGSFVAGNDLVFRIYADTYTAPTTQYFTMTAQNTETLAPITNFQAMINGTYYVTTNGTINTALNSTWGNVSIEVNSTGFFSNSTVTYNISSNYTANLTAIKYFNASARDYFTNKSISNFNLTIGYSNGTLEYYTTTNGSVMNTNATQLTGLINVTFSSYQFWPITYTNYNSSKNISGNMTAAELYVTAKNIVTNATILSFTANSSNMTWTTTTGTVWINITNGTNTINFTASGYATLSPSYTLASQSNTSSTIYFVPTITLNLYNETGGGPFHPNQTTSTTLRVFCPTKTIEINMTTNSTSTNSIDCSWDYMRMFVTYGNTTYYRTLIPALTSTSINWYLINLNVDTVVQKTFYLNDITSQYGDGTFITDKIINTTQVRINEEEWDIENKVIVYMIVYNSYILSVTDNDDVTKVLGPFLADTSTSVTITVPTIPFEPDSTFDDILWGYESDQLAGWLYMSYSITAGSISSVNWVIQNASNPSQVFLNTTFVTTNGTANYTSMLNGTIYKSVLTITHLSLGTKIDTKLWGGGALSDNTLPGVDNPSTFKKWLAFILIMVFTLIFSGLSIGAAAITFTTMTSFFSWIGYINIPTLYLIIFGVVTAYIVFVAEGIR